MRTKENQVRHDQGVIAWVKQLLRDGWKTVYADLPGVAKPPQIGNHIPDIYAEYEDQNTVQKIIIEIETQDSVNLEHTNDQISVFTAWKNQFSMRQFLVKIV